MTRMMGGEGQTNTDQERNGDNDRKMTGEVGLVHLKGKVSEMKHIEKKPFKNKLSDNVTGQWGILFWSMID